MTLIIYREPWFRYKNSFLLLEHFACQINKTILECMYFTFSCFKIWQFASMLDVKSFFYRGICVFHSCLKLPNISLSMHPIIMYLFLPRIYCVGLSSIVTILSLSLQHHAKYRWSHLHTKHGIVKQVALLAI